MKRILFGMMAALTLAASCQNDFDYVPNGEETAQVTFNVGTPEIATRTFSDGKSATKLEYAVYSVGENDALTQLLDLNGEKTFSISTDVQLQLTTGNKYAVIFWAAAEDAPYTVNFSTKTMTVDYANAVSNDEERDAFYAYHEFTVTGSQTETVYLKRPFAQLNIGTNDYEESASAGYTPAYSYVKVPVSAVLNLVDGTVDTAAEVEFKLAAIPANEEFPVADYDYLSMNYLLVAAEKEVVDIEFGYSEDATTVEKSRIVGSVPVQRNHRTNIYGQLLTSDVDVNVEIKPEYDDPKYDNEYLYYISEGIYHITSAEGLNYFAEQVNAGNAEWLSADVVLDGDIDLSNVAVTRSSASNWTPIGMSSDLGNGKTFTGTFDGQGHTIKNMVCTGSEVAGLFGYLYAATIKNVTIESATIKSNHFAGGIAAWVNNLKGNIQKPFVIENCHVVNSTITSTPELVNSTYDNGDKVGGLVGALWMSRNGQLNDGAKVANSSVKNTTVKAYRDLGGLIGLAEGAVVENCVTENVTVEQDLTNGYKDEVPTTVGSLIGRDEGGNTVDGNNYYADGVTQDAEGNFHILNAAGLKWLADEENSYDNYNSSLTRDKIVYLENDIDLGGVEWTPIGDFKFSASRFWGTFDGQGHTISNFKITKKTDRDDANKSSYGLFGNVDAAVKNLTVSNATIDLPVKFAGVLVGRLLSGAVVENCHVINSSVECDSWTVGALVGQLNKGAVVRNSSVENTSVTGLAAVGGVAGIVLENEGTIENCSVKNCVFAQTEPYGEGWDDMFGAITGAVYEGAGAGVNINNCVAEGNTIKGAASNALYGYADAAAVVKVNGVNGVASKTSLVAALTAGGEYALVNDITFSESVAISGSEFTLDGNGYTITMADDATNAIALFDINGGKATIKNVVFDGIKNGAVVRTVDTDFEVDNVTAQNCTHNVGEGLFRLRGKNTIKNSTFKNNTSSQGLILTLNFDGANPELPQVVEKCVFEGNTANSSAIVYYVKGSSCTINANQFVGNTVNCDTNGATVYMGFQENCVITNNLFKNNTVNEASTSSRVAGGVFFGYDAVFTGNAFVGNNVTGENAVAKDVCVSTYYTSINLSGNYWGGSAPVEDVNYFVQHKSDERTVIINDYLTTY